MKSYLGKKELSAFLIFLTGFLTVFSFFYLDKSIAIFFSEIPQNIFLAFEILTFFASNVFIIFVLVVLLIYYIKTRSRKLVYIISSVSLTWLVTYIIKITLGRTRPSLFIEKDLFQLSLMKFADVMNSFPSAHSSTAFALATSVSLLYPKYKYFLFFYAFMIALSRIVIGKHYLSDVIFGAFLGIVASIILKDKLFPVKNITNN